MARDKDDDGDTGVRCRLDELLVRADRSGGAAA